MDTKNLNRTTSTYNPYSQGKTQQGDVKTYRKKKMTHRCAVCHGTLKDKVKVIELSPRYYGHVECLFKDEA